MAEKSLLAFLAALILTTAGLYAAAEPLIGDGNDGNRSTPVHLMPLLDEKGVQIRPGDKVPQPFSLNKTCGQCHSVDIISRGWHFQPAEPDGQDGRPGQPFIFTDLKTRTVIPLSDRNWPGVFKPSQIGLSRWEWMKLFASHIPGNAYGRFDDAEKDPHETLRKQISGTYEINCLACHNADPRQDQSAAALQAARQNYKWIPAGSSGLAVVNGTALALSDFFDPEFDTGITMTYNPSIFDKEGNVFMDITRKIPNDRCYFCHSVRDMSVPQMSEWTRDGDVHIHSGLNCTDCHRNGLDHKMARGEQTSKADRKGLSCEGCHLGQEPQAAGRLGAPRPKHAGIPTAHFEKLSCTACHSGPLPKEQAGQVKTAAVHKLGLHGVHKVELNLPHIYEPVFLKGPDGKIGPYRLIWPAYWGIMKDGKITPITPKAVLKAAGDILDSAKEKFNDWNALNQEQILESLKRLAGQTEEGKPVYVCGGRVFSLSSDGGLDFVEHPSASAYTWPIGHDVRPKEQSLGIKGCSDCHSTDSAFFFGTVPVDAPLPKGFEPVEMVRLEGLDGFYVWWFNFSFVFRPWLKSVLLICCGITGLVVLAYALKAVSVIAKASIEDEG